MTEITDELLLKQFKEILQQVGPQTSAAKYDRLGIPRPARGTLAKRFGSWNEAKTRALYEDIQQSDETHIALAEQNKVLLKRIEKERNHTQAFVNNCLASIAKMNIKPVTPPKKETHTENLEAHAMRSDAHVGEEVTKESVQGISNYGSEIYKQRIGTWIDKMITFREQDKKSLGLNKLVVYYLGDQVTGETIFRGQAFYLDLNLTDQLFYSVEVESNALLALAQVYPNVEIFCVLGNHGRPGMKGANHWKTNFDYLFYRSLKQTLANQKNIQVYISESPSMIVQHGNFIFFLTHGDAAKGWMGIPFYGLERMLRRLPGLYNMVIHYMLCGHFHQPAAIGDSKILLNGSVVGGSELSINRMGLTNLPSQKLFYFDKVHGINRETDLHLALPMELKPDKHGVFTPWV